MKEKKNIFKDRKEFKGFLIKQIVEGFEYIELLNKTKATFEGLIRKDERDYPVEAIREAYGIGIQKIILNYKKYKIKPIIKTEVGVFQVVLPNIHYQENIDKKESQVFGLSNNQKTIL